MSEIEQYIITEDYIQAVTKNDFSKIPEIIQRSLEEHLIVLQESKSARKKELKKIKALQKKLAKTESSKKNVEDMTDEDYLKMRMEQFEEFGINPFPHYFETNYHLRSFEKEFGYLKNDESIPDKVIKLTGRIMLKRASSKKLYFYTMEADGNELQVLATLNHYNNPEEFIKMTQVISRGDVIGIEGFPHRSKRGELSIIPTRLTLISPCLKLLPKNVKDSTGREVSAYTNKESRFRNRHLDWMLNPHNRNILKTRSRIIRFIRNYFDERDFFEVETPTLNLVSSGANAKPFNTHINAFNLPVFLRIAPELRLKQMIIGGFERVYEIGKQFRNEDVDRTHLPEFTSIEFYQMGADYYGLMKTTEELLSSLVYKLRDSFQISYNLEPNEEGVEEEVTIDFTPPFKKLDMKETLFSRIKETIKDFEYPKDMFSEDARKYFSEIVEQLGIECSPPRTTARLIDKLVGEFIEPECINPTFITNHFQVMSPLAKYHRENPELTERFELFIAGKELCNAFTELNNPLVQQKLFEEQVKDKNLGDEEAQMKDDDFIDAMKYGLPPTGGWGMGIDRLVMFLTNNNTIREVVTYPTMKPV